MRIDGYYFDGKVSQAVKVILSFDESGNLKVTAPKFNLYYAFDTLEFSPRIGNTQRDILFPDGGKCETTANDQIDSLLKRRRVLWFYRLIHHLETKLIYVLAAILLMLGFSYGLVNYGIPHAAKKVAFALPAETDAQLGKQTLDALDKLVFTKSKLKKEVRDHLRISFQKIAAESDSRQTPIRFLFRNSEKMGANAITLPAGVVVITDQLVELADNEEELVAIVAHEVGHVFNRHALRTVLQSSAVVLAFSWLTGDISSLSVLSAALPAQMVEAKYSRQFEWEADRFARDYLIKNQIPLHRFTDMLSRIEAQLPSGEESFTFLSSHPATEDRIRLFDVKS